MAEKTATMSKSAQIRARHEADSLATRQRQAVYSGLRFDYSQIAANLRPQVQEAALEIRRRERRAAEDLLAMGQKLLEVKEILAHRQFTRWVEDEFDLGVRMAQQCMAAVERFGGKNELSSLLGATVMRRLAAPSVPDEAIEDVRDFIRREGRAPKVTETEHIIEMHKAPPRMITVNATVSTPEPPAVETDDAPPDTQFGPIAIAQPTPGEFPDEAARLADEQEAINQVAAELAEEDREREERERVRADSGLPPSPMPLLDAIEEVRREPQSPERPRDADTTVRALVTKTPAAIGFRVALSEATKAEIVEAMANLSSEDRYHEEKLARYRQRLKELALESARAAGDERSATVSVRMDKQVTRKLHAAMVAGALDKYMTFGQIEALRQALERALA